MMFLSFFHKKNPAYRAAIWIMAGFFFFWTSTGYAATFSGGSGSGYSMSEGSAPIPAKVVFTTQPKVVFAGQVFSQAPVVAIYDSNDNLCPAATNTVALAILNNPSSATLSGTDSMAAVAGVADFSEAGLSIDKAGDLYTLQASSSGLTSATSDSFSLIANDVQVKSELTYDAGTSAYLINSWIETKGAIMAGGTYVAGNITVTIYDKSGNALTGANAPGTATVLNDSVFRQSWLPPNEKDSYIAKIVITYKGQAYTGSTAYNPSVQGTLSSIGGTVGTIASNVTDIKAKTDGMNWSDITAIKTAVGAGQAETVYQKVGSILTSVSKANWDDMKIMSEAGINWSDMRTQTRAGVNWNDVRVLTRAGIKWSDIATFSTVGVNWTDLTSLTTKGINWTDIGRLARATVNWEDIGAMTAKGINWTDIKVLTQKGINWTDIDRLTKATVNWEDIGVMSAKGVNWVDIGRLSKASVNWDDLNKMSVAGVNWSDFKVLSTQGVNWADIDRLSTVGVNWEDLVKMSKGGVNWLNVGEMAAKGINWDDVDALAKAGVNWADLKVMTQKGVNWSGIDALSKSGVNWSGIQAFSKGR